MYDCKGVRPHAPTPPEYAILNHPVPNGIMPAVDFLPLNLL
jgi:hypothetical protein